MRASGHRQLWHLPVIALAAALGTRPCPALAQAVPPAIAEPPQAASRGSGLPVPRFVSLKSDRVNLRQGPGTDYPATWVFRRAGLPVEVIQEFETWRKVRDAEGTTGWVLGSLLSGRRTAVVLPWEIKPGVPLPQAVIRAGRSERAGAVASVEAGVIASLASCDGSWCRVTVGDFSGYLEQKSLWGVYENETIR